MGTCIPELMTFFFLKITEQKNYLARMSIIAFRECSKSFSVENGNFDTVVSVSLQMSDFQMKCCVVSRKLRHYMPYTT